MIRLGFAILPAIATVWLGVLSANAATEPGVAPDGHTLAAQTRHRPHVIIRPRRLGPDARRICQSWLAQEYRPSGTVITPQMRCWWEQ